VFAGQSGANGYVGNPPAVKLSPRGGFAFSVNPQTVFRGGYGLFWGPWSSGVEQSAGYSATTEVQQDVNRPITSIDNPFPNGLAQITGDAAGMLTGTSANISFIDPDRDAPRVHQYSVDMQRQLPNDMSVGLTYMGATSRHLTWGTSVNINQIDPRYYSLGSALTANLTNPFFGNPGAGSFATRTTLPRNQLLRPFPQYGNVTMTQSTLGKAQYHAAVIALTKRTTGWWGGRVSYTWSRLDDNQFGQGNYYSSAPGILNNYTAVPGSAYFDPDAEYGRSLLDSPHKLVASPIIRLPFGDGHRWLTDGVGAALAGGWTVSFVIQMQSGFPIGVSQSSNNTNSLGGNQRPNIVPGVDFMVDGSITDRLKANPNDNLYLNPAAFSEAPAGTLGNAPRILPDVYSPWRNSTDMRIRRDIGLGGTKRVSLDLEVINLFDNPWYAALASVAYSPTSGTFGRVTAQANYSRTLQFTGRFSF
jgi:hypothetical protein